MCAFLCFFFAAAAACFDVSGRDSIPPGADGGADEQQAMLLQPMPFSVKMRELMVWATNTVIPVMGRVRGSGGADGVPKAGAEGTPGELGWAGLSPVVFVVFLAYDSCRCFCSFAR